MFRIGVCAASVAAVAGVGIAAASGATITQPRGATTVAANAPLAISAGGFTPGTQVFVEQCDGVPESVAGWTPSLHCDLGTSPSPVIADSNGNAVFPVDNPNHVFRVFEGESPQSLFNCMSAHRTAPNNSLPSFTNCRVRVSSNNADVTADQAFVPIVLSGAVVTLPSTTVPKSTTSTSRPAGASGATPTTLSTSKAKAQAKAATSKAAHAAAVKSAAAAKKAKDGAQPSASAAVAEVHAGSSGSDGAGMLALSDPGVVLGYLLLLGGLLLATAPALLRRRRLRAATRPAAEAPR